MAESTGLENQRAVTRSVGSNPTATTMSTFEYKNDQWVCKKCGSTNVFIKAGMMVDRAWCRECNNEDYL